MNISSILIGIGGATVPGEQLHDYTIRFYQGAEGPVPVLYFQGKRVTKCWRIELVADIPEDRFGGNANTS